MSSRLLIVPAAGLGTRLGGTRPKLLVPVGGIPMIDRLLALFADAVDRAVVVVHPSFEREVREHLARPAVPVTTVVQRLPTGMLDAIMLAEPAVRSAAPDEVWISWCDQVAIHPVTIQRLVELTAGHPEAAVVMPTVTRQIPYIHLQRDGAGRIVEILHRREGDAMPDEGESDMGLFALPSSSFTDLLPRYAQEVALGTSTGERNFLPFIAWASAEHEVVTFPSVDDMEAVGVNTPEELQAVEAYLAAREAASA
jgi:bifunctional UDP-N-acetylglucosamine pyrophosphorylase/glucosamine-1-phosphate N-acetyltransferase